MKIKHYTDLLGKRFGKLIVINYAGPNKFGSATWLCKCDCGKEKIIRASSLKRNYAKSCGCLKLSKTLPKGEAAFNRYFYHIKMDALKRNIKFFIEKKDVKSLIYHRCFYCGIEPRQEFKLKNENGSLIYNGIDRLDSLKGYELGNVVPCCGRCNEAKNNLHFKDYIEWVQRTYLFLFDKSKYNEFFSSGGICGI